MKKCFFFRPVRRAQKGRQPCAFVPAFPKAIPLPCHAAASPLLFAAVGAGNGFKMGGTNLPGNHKLVNSISYDNAAKGIDSNSCTDVKVYNSTSYNNEDYNVALYTGNKSAVTDYRQHLPLLSKAKAAA